MNSPLSLSHSVFDLSKERKERSKAEEMKYAAVPYSVAIVSQFDFPIENSDTAKFCL